MNLFLFIFCGHLSAGYATSFSSEECSIQNVGGFLQNVCTSPQTSSNLNNILGLKTLFLKCVKTDQFYQIEFKIHARSGCTSVDVLCEHDPIFYQACASFGVFSSTQKFEPTSSDLPCGYLCERHESAPGLRSVISSLSFADRFGNVNNFMNFACDGVASCLNTDLDESSCEKSTLQDPGLGANKNVRLCDLVCDMVDCEDECSCNGFNYGIWCDDHQKYRMPSNICRFNVTGACVDGRDVAICDLSHEVGQKSILPICKQTTYANFTIPLYNFTRCSAIIQKSGFKEGTTHFTMIELCDDFLDQTNCTDYARVGLHCSIRGHMSTVSQQIICVDRSLLTSAKVIPALCDDYSDKACISLSVSCEVHKHKMCDELLDCKDGSDETHGTCQDMADKNCVRRYVFERHGQKSAIPIAWVNDGMIDCMNGEDEESTWPQCGYGRTRRFKKSLNDSCGEVFLCDRSSQFIEFSRLCDKIESCSNENHLCEKSRALVPTYAKAFQEDPSEIKLSYCMKGIDRIGNLRTGQYCFKQKFVSFENEPFGKNHSLRIHAPNAMVDCTSFFGESYVFLSCLGLCENSPGCPVALNPSINVIKFDSCPGQFRSDKVFTLGSDGNLTFLVIDRKTGLLGNNFFVCQNTSVCLTYDKVCNLADDCGDGSDELLCINHFQCKTSKELLHVSQKCDGVFHCLDRSDECNKTCGNTIVGQLWLRIFAWLIGIVAIVLNLGALAKNISLLSKCKSEAALLSSCLVIVIHIGDLLGGVYLTVLASYDSYYGESLCGVQLEWLTSSACATLGISSTISLQISLFAMTALSLIRAIGVTNEELRVLPTAISRKSVFKLVSLVTGVVLLSFLVSCLPILSYFEDYFVNGLKFENSNTLFLECPNKKKLMAIIQEYYGRMQMNKKVLSWSRIKKLVRAMFSEDHGGIQYRTLSFYGNHPVCVFKYLVRWDDPQRTFTALLLFANICCFVVITTSYAAIAAASRKSVKALSPDNKNKTNLTVRKTDARLHRVIHAMIFSDFLCWIPFTIVCWVHLFDVFDATPWYPLFSILILPINTVVNPILYESTVTRALDAAFLKLKSKYLNLHSKIRNILQGPSLECPDVSIGPSIGRIPTEVVTQLERENSIKLKDCKPFCKANVSGLNKNSNNSSEATVLVHNKNSNNSSEATATVLVHNKISNNSSEATVLEQNKNSNNSSEATVLEQNKNSNNSSEATVLVQNKNSNNSSEATVLEHNKNSNNSSEASVLEQNKNSNNSSEATVLEHNKKSNNSSEATVLEQKKNSNNSSEATVLEQNKNSNNSGEATVLEQNKDSNNSSEATVLEHSKNSNNSSEATELEQNKNMNSNNSSEATVLEKNKNSSNSSEDTMLEQNKNINNSITTQH